MSEPSEHATGKEACCNSIAVKIGILRMAIGNIPGGNPSSDQVSCLSATSVLNCRLLGQPAVECPDHVTQDISALEMLIGDADISTYISGPKIVCPAFDHENVYYLKNLPDKI